MCSEILVLEKNERVRTIFERILECKNLIGSFVTTEAECLETFQNSIDKTGKTKFSLVIFENSLLLPNGEKLEGKIQESDNQQKIILLPQCQPKGNASREITDLIEKPFSLISALATNEIRAQSFTGRELLA